MPNSGNWCPKSRFRIPNPNRKRLCQESSQKTVSICCSCHGNKHNPGGLADLGFRTKEIKFNIDVTSSSGVRSVFDIVMIVNSKLFIPPDFQKHFVFDFLGVDEVSLDGLEVELDSD